MVVILQKMVMTGAMCVVAQGSSVQLLIAILVMLSYMLLVLKTAPYEENSEDWSAFVACVALTLTTIGGFALMTDNQNARTYESKVLGLILIGINGVCIALEIFIVVVFDCDGLSQCKKICGGKVIATKNEKIDQSSKTKVQPIQEIKSGSERHKKLRDIRLKYGAGSKEYKEVALGVQEKQSTEMKETENKNTEPISSRVKSKPQSKLVSTVVGTNSSLAITVMMLVGSFVVGGVDAYAKMPDGCKDKDRYDRSCYPRKAVDDFLQDYRDNSGNFVSKPSTAGTKAEVLATYGPMKDWDMSSVTDISWLFYQKRTMNADLSSWNVSSVTTMRNST